jgi:hypothetical protein
MGQTTDQIEHHIEQTRETLGSNLQELERKVKSATDWRQQFQERPMIMIGAAFGAGVLLATVVRGRRHNGEPHFASRQDFAGTQTRKPQGPDLWDNLKSALLGVAATRVKDYVSGMVPGFREEFDRTQSEPSKPWTGNLHG